MGLLSGIIKGVGKAVQTIRDLPGKINRWDLSRDIRKNTTPVQTVTDIPVVDDSWRRHKKRRVPAGAPVVNTPKPITPVTPKPVTPVTPVTSESAKPELSNQFLAICSVAGLDFDLLDDFVAKHQELCSRLGPKTSFTDDEYREIMFAVQLYMEQMTMMDRYIDWGSIDGTYIDAWGNIVSESDNSVIKSAGSF